MITAVTNDTGVSSTDRITNDNTLILSGTAEANSLVTLTRIGMGAIGTATADATGIWSFDYTGTMLANGSHKLLRDTRRMQRGMWALVSHSSSA